MLHYSNTGLLISPQADTASPAASMFCAALMSRSCFVRHSGQSHIRTERGSFKRTCPHVQHRLLDGYHWSMPINVRPYHSALYSNCRTNSLQPESEIDLAKRQFFCMLEILRLSMAITWFSSISRVESLWRKSFLESEMRACNRATFNRAFARFLEPFCFLDRRFCKNARRFSHFRKILGEAIFSPVERIAKCVNPRSIPICPVTSCLEETSSVQSRETWYRPEGSFDTVTVEMVAALGSVRDQRMASGSFILARINEVPSHLKALAVYSADCLSNLVLNLGYKDRLAKKFANAVCKWRSDCWTGTELTSFSHTCSGFFFNSVRREDVLW